MNIRRVDPPALITGILATFLLVFAAIHSPTPRAPTTLTIAPLQIERLICHHGNQDEVRGYRIETVLATLVPDLHSIGSGADDHCRGLAMHLKDSFEQIWSFVERAKSNKSRLTFYGDLLLDDRAKPIMHNGKFVVALYSVTDGTEKFIIRRGGRLTAY